MKFKKNGECHPCPQQPSRRPPSPPVRRWHRPNHRSPPPPVAAGTGLTSGRRWHRPNRRPPPPPVRRLRRSAAPSTPPPNPPRPAAASKETTRLAAALGHPASREGRRKMWDGLHRWALRGVLRHRRRLGKRGCSRVGRPEGILRFARFDFVGRKKIGGENREEEIRWWGPRDKHQTLRRERRGKLVICDQRRH
jgi:hypothetical protein